MQHKLLMMQSKPAQKPQHTERERMQHKLLMMQSKPAQKPQHRKRERMQHKLLMTWRKQVGKQLEFPRTFLLFLTLAF